MSKEKIFRLVSFNYIAYRLKTNFIWSISYLDFFIYFNFLTSKMKR